jgi:hypothetical protein
LPSPARSADDPGGNSRTSVQTQLAARGHRLAQQGEPQRPGIEGRDRLGEEHPHMCAIAGAGDLDRRWDPQIASRLGIGLGVQPPLVAVEVAGQQPTGVIGQDRIQPRGDLAGQVVVQDRVGQRPVPPRGVGLLPGLPRLPVHLRRPALPAVVLLPPSRVDVLPAGEQRPIQRHPLRSNPITVRRGRSSSRCPCHGGHRRLCLRQGRCHRH